MAPGLDKQNVLVRLHRAIEGHNGVEVPRILTVAQKKGLIVKVPSWKIATAEFGNIGAKSGYFRGKSTRLSDEEIERFSSLLED